ncbi:hypothetical protein HG535_0E00600 [Zygotorulaspora mrakii]|uniref:PhoD-like phosphatase domain-containing protein n=1 Tax=Zygotorulaspora mrakii TaxID=42260 RepID=A0A7H9B3G3_ZYGMR|nr:uncharacterized protein HG535_0E00600 [Zygotorulaspora mrakii]QLG72976.1 hypothetical protein HG535_0E00600 [Zygotorulaspora mrakii]
MNFRENWFGDWDTEQLYAELVDGCDDCAITSPVVKSGMVCGPILRLRKVDYDENVYYGSILVVLKGPAAEGPKIAYTTGPASEQSEESLELKLKDGVFESTMFHREVWDDENISFFRYNIALPLTEKEQMVKYALDGESKPHYRFFIPSATTNFNTISYSCNGFSLSVDTKKFKGSLWFDILNKHSKVHYNVMLGGGDQIYSDGITIYCEKVKEWSHKNDLLQKRTMKVDGEFKKQLDDFYLKEYIEWYGYGHWKGSTDDSKTTQRCLPIAMATIPSVNIWDDHDIIDGFGSYSDGFMKSDVFSSIGKAAYKYYMLFQHHVSIEESEAYLKDPIWLLGNRPGPYIGERSHSVFTRLGPTMGLLGLDCRTERKLAQIVTDETYDIVFKKMEEEAKKSNMDHLLVMLGVPIAYPRLVLLEWLFTSRLLHPLKILSRKGIIAGGLVNKFNGDIELLDDLDDHWCARHHKKERNGLMARLQDFGAKYSTRITILSGDVHLASIGRFKSKKHRHHIFSSSEHDADNAKIENEPENDLRLMFNVISSAVVNTPPPNAMAALLQSKATIHHFDHETDEDAVPIFKYGVDEKSRASTCFLNRRNWSDILPVENALNNEFLKSQFRSNLQDRVVPGIVTGGKPLKKVDPQQGQPSSETKEGYSAYPITEKGILVSLFIETDPLSAKSCTTRYALPIPELKAQCDSLTHSGLKHWKLK